MFNACFQGFEGCYDEENTLKNEENTLVRRGKHSENEGITCYPLLPARKWLKRDGQITRNKKQHFY